MFGSLDGSPFGEMHLCPLGSLAKVLFVTEREYLEQKTLMHNVVTISRSTYAPLPNVVSLVTEKSIQRELERLGVFP